ncbi:MAG TPA: type II toxin-antitoxin system HicA family toxin [Sedimentisphaerales bacterium]|nr:type II toxin-antitoxin system HicA family toxin [Sedimentisphaerales bacterium]
MKGLDVGRHGKLIEHVLSGRSDANIRFADLVQLLLHLGFEERTRGDHHIFTRTDIEEILNLQPRGSAAKPYQVKQVRNVILKYKLGVNENE